MELLEPHGHRDPLQRHHPQGEVGINPAYTDVEYRVWRAEADSHGRVHPVEEVGLKIAPRLIDTKHTLMRGATPARAGSGL